MRDEERGRKGGMERKRERERNGEKSNWSGNKTIKVGDEREIEGRKE